MYIYVLNKKGEPLMPTARCGHVRKLIEQGLAVPVCNNPFTIKLKYDTTNYIQDVTLGFDTGRENIGIAARDKDNNKLLSANVKTDNQKIKKNMSERKEHRKARRRHKRIKKQRKAIRNNTTIQNGQSDWCRTKKACQSKKVRYPGMEETITHKVIQGAEAQFNNRRREDGWLTPSSRHLIQDYISITNLISKFLPITAINIEYTSFNNYQRDKNPPEIKQNTKCLLCGKHSIEHFHHIIYKSKNGSNNSKNMAGLCSDCHTRVHNSKEYENKLLSINPGSYIENEITLLDICLPYIITSLELLYPVYITYGYETKELRETIGLEKDHYIDAYCISLSNRTNNIVPPFNKDNHYNIKHFKKKSNNKINQLGSRKYCYNGKCVATNRHKAFNQKEDSLEEYMIKYAETHTDKECRQHFHELEVRPATRNYTIHKSDKRPLFKLGDKIKYCNDRLNRRKIIIAENIVNSENKVRYNNTKNCRFKHCTLLESKSFVFI